MLRKQSSVPFTPWRCYGNSISLWDAKPTSNTIQQWRKSKTLHPRRWSYSARIRKRRSLAFLYSQSHIQGTWPRLDEGFKSRLEPSQYIIWSCYTSRCCVYNLDREVLWTQRNSRLKSILLGEWLVNRRWWQCQFRVCRLAGVGSVTDSRNSRDRNYERHIRLWFPLKTCSR